MWRPRRSSPGGSSTPSTASTAPPAAHSSTTTSWRRTSSVPCVTRLASCIYAYYAIIIIHDPINYHNTKVMAPPSRIFQCNNGHLICEDCKCHSEVACRHRAKYLYDDCCTTYPDPHVPHVPRAAGPHQPHEEHPHGEARQDLLRAGGGRGVSA